MPVCNILLDRDGTIIEDRHYLADPAGVTLLPGAGEALARLAKAGARLFVVTNQSGIGRGYFTLQDYEACTKRLGELLQAHGVSLADVAFCPHAPEAECSCRKPGQGMWVLLRDRYHLRPEETVMVGDKFDDVRFGRDAGFAASVLVLTGKGADAAQRHGLQPPAGGYRVDAPATGMPHVVARDLGAVADWLLERGLDVLHGGEKA